MVITASNVISGGVFWNQPATAIIQHAHTDQFSWPHGPSQTDAGLSLPRQRALPLNVKKVNVQNRTSSDAFMGVFSVSVWSHLPELKMLSLAECSSGGGDWLGPPLHLEDWAVLQHRVEARGPVCGTEAHEGQKLNKWWPWEQDKEAKSLENVSLGHTFERIWSVSCFIFQFKKKIKNRFLVQMEIMYILEQEQGTKSMIFSPNYTKISPVWNHGYICFCLGYPEVDKITEFFNTRI